MEARDGYYQRTPLHFASLSDNPEAVKALITANARVNVLDSRNVSPLQFAVNDNEPLSVIALCNAGADPADLNESAKSHLKKMLNTYPSVQGRISAWSKCK